MSDVTSEQSGKRMRLGTRSCAECRRRRVRCIYPAKGSACEACLRHDTPCQSQQPKASTDSSSLVSDDAATLRQRLEGLEAVVRELRGGMPLSPESSTSVPALSNEQTSSINYTDSLSSDSVGHYTPLLGEAEAMDGSTHAPLINLIKTTLLIETVDDHSGLPTFDLAPGVRDSIRKIRRYLPPRAGIYSILESTELYWSAWPAYYYGPGSSDRVGPGQLADTVGYICQDLESTQAPTITKAMLWLALCLQQLPLVRDEDELHLPATAKVLVELYIGTARTVLETVSGQKQEIASVESYLFLCKLYINMGKPQKAWMFGRQGMGVAYLQGLHRLDTHADERRKYVWGQIWQVDLSTSMLLGFPWSLSMSHPAISPDLNPSAPNAELWYAMSGVVAAIIDRDQSRTTDYATTVRLDQEWERCAALMPDEWWNETANTILGFSAIYYRQVIKALIFTLRKLIHMPYMLKAQANSRYEHSRASAVEASRQVIHAYCGLRENEVTRRVFCEVMDFQAFSAGLVIAVNLLNGDSTSDNHGDWDLITKLEGVLRRASALANCPVSGQGAHLLKLILIMHRGESGAPRRYEATIPYFGRVSLSYSRPTEDPCPSALHLDQPSTYAYGHDLDLNIDLFDYESLANVDFEAGLTMDWTTLFEQ